MGLFLQLLTMRANQPLVSGSGMSCETCGARADTPLLSHHFFKFSFEILDTY